MGGIESGGLAGDPDVAEGRECRDFADESSRAGADRPPGSYKELLKRGGTFTPPLCFGRRIPINLFSN